MPSTSVATSVAFVLGVGAGLGVGHFGREGGLYRAGVCLAPAVGGSDRELPIRSMMVG